MIGIVILIGIVIFVWIDPFIGNTRLVGINSFVVMGGILIDELRDIIEFIFGIYPFHFGKHPPTMKTITNIYMLSHNSSRRKFRAIRCSRYDTTSTSVSHVNTITVSSNCRTRTIGMCKFVIRHI